MGILSGLEPQNVFAYFEAISAIPRASYHEEKISDYCVAFAKEHHLEWYQDSLKNVIIIKEASAGYEAEPPVIIQGHLDMVCEKEPGSTIDFDTDGIKLLTDGNTITADGTTLGADDGIAIAYALALLSDQTIAHPKLEVVLTVCEEVGLEGASGIDVSMLTGRRLLNLDSEEEGIFLAGCAGGAGAVCRLPLRQIPADGASLMVPVTGLTGGHSGAEINKGRGNANLLMGRVLLELSSKVRFTLAALEGGKKDNAIPRTCTATLCLAPADLEKAETAILATGQNLSGEYAVTDKDLKLVTERNMNLPSAMLDEFSTQQAVMFVNMLPAGIQTMSPDVPDLPETSLNPGILKLEGTQLTLQYAVRSSVESAKQALLDKLAFLTGAAGGSIEISGVYPAWEYRRNSPFREKLAAIYEKMYGKQPAVVAIHAGVECGLFAGKIPDLDCVSLGPDMHSIHTTEETLSVASVKRVWEYLLEVLKTK